MEAERLNQQIAYYRARAGEYDQWFFRRGRYDRGAEQNAIWFQEVGIVRAALEEFSAKDDVLELAGGTGLWTELLAKTATTLAVIDSSPEVIEINRHRVDRDDVRYVEADLFAWQPDRRYDVVFFSFWHSHVPPEKFDSFWGTVKDALLPGGRVFLVDSLFQPTSTATDHVLPDPSEVVMTRRLNDGREFQIYKVFYRAEDLTAKLNDRGWTSTLHETDHYFLYGSCRPSE